MVNELRAKLDASKKDIGALLPILDARADPKHGKWQEIRLPTTSRQASVEPCGGEADEGRFQLGGVVVAVKHGTGGAGERRHQP